MPVRVIIAPEPIVTPDEITGLHAADDDAVAGAIAAVQAEIDGPSGWLGRSLGEQTLEYCFAGFCGARAISLPCRPVIDIESVIYVDHEGAEQEISEDSYRKAGDMLWFVPSFSFPTTYFAPDAVKVRYRAGYDGVPMKDGGTGDVPAQAKRAIILSVQHMLSIGAENLFLRAEEVEGVGRQEFTVSEAGGKIIRDAADRLLQGLRVYA